MIFTRDFVTRENYWQIASLVTQKSLFMVTHALFFIWLSPSLLRYYRITDSRMAIVLHQPYQPIGCQTCIDIIDDQAKTVSNRSLPSVGLKSSFQSVGMHQPHRPPHIMNTVCRTLEMSCRKIVAMWPLLVQVVYKKSFLFVDYAQPTSYIHTYLLV